MERVTKRLRMKVVFPKERPPTKAAMEGPPEVDLPASYMYGPAPADVIERTRRMREICKRHGAILPSVALQFPLAHPAFAAIIPGAKRLTKPLRAAAASTCRCLGRSGTSSNQKGCSILRRRPRISRRRLTPRTCEDQSPRLLRRSRP